VWVKGPGSEVCHSSSFSADVKKEWICNSNPPHAFMACIGVASSFIASGIFNRFLKKNPTFH
jgi:hypothetical protein